MKTTICFFFLAAVAGFAQTNDLVMPQTFYVSADGPQSLQWVVDAANPGDEIVVAPGVYDVGGRQHDEDGLLVRLVVDKPLTVRSEAGAEETFLVGGPLTRCLYLTNDAKVIGFTITGGETGKQGLDGNKFFDLSGGGVWSEPAGVLEDCVVVSNTALWYGGGLYGGVAERCVFKDNLAQRSGGGVSHSRLGSCVLAYNRAGRFGGGAQRSELFNCTVAHNRAEMMGGGAALGLALNSVLHHNQALLGDHNYFETEMTYSCSWPQPKGVGNIGMEPDFKNTDAGVFTLQYSSPMIDRGINCFLRADAAGLPRILDGNNNGHAQVDMGAFEYVHPYADSDGDGTLDIDAARATHR